MTRSPSSPDSAAVLQQFVDMFRSGEQGADIDCDAAQKLALAIDALLQPATPTAKWRCDHCDNGIDFEWEFCAWCGASENWKTAEPATGGDAVAGEAKAAGYICQDQHRRGYCTEPGCSLAVAATAREAIADRLVDWTYLHATEGQQWPSTKTKSMLIARAMEGEPTQDHADGMKAAAPGDAAQPSRNAVIEECAKVAESYPSSGEQTEHPVEYWIRRLSISSTDRPHGNPEKEERERLDRWGIGK